MLGDLEINRKLAKVIAGKLSLKIAGTPFIHLRFNKFDKDYLSIKTKNASHTDFLAELDLSDRIITEIDKVTDTVLNEKIDFTYPKKVIEEKRKTSVEFLIKALEGTDVELELLKYRDIM